MLKIVKFYNTQKLSHIEPIGTYKWSEGLGGNIVWLSQEV